MKIDNITLENVAWINEFFYEPVVQEQIRSVTGGLLNFEQAQPVGETMTLSGAWVTRAQLQALQTLRAQAKQTHTVLLDDGRKYQTIFDRSNGALTISAVDGPYTEPSPTDRYAITLNLQIITQIFDDED